MAAEVARVEGGSLDLALDLYEQAIEGAHREGFLQDGGFRREAAALNFFADETLPVLG